MLEYWSDGKRQPGQAPSLQYSITPTFHYSTTPLLHYSTTPLLHFPPLGQMTSFN